MLKYIAVISLTSIAMSVSYTLRAKTISSFRSFLTKKISKYNVPSFSLSRISGWAKQHKTALSVILALILLDRVNWGAQKYRKWQKRPKNNPQELPEIPMPEEEPFVLLTDQIPPQPEEQEPTIVEQGPYPPGVEGYEPAVSVQFYGVGESAKPEIPALRVNVPRFSNKPLPPGFMLAQ